MKRKNNKKKKQQPEGLKSIKNYSMIAKNYDEYLNFQLEKHAGHESKHSRWSKGQIRFIDKNFSKLDRSLKIIDIACGDGVGLFQFKKLNFYNVIGVELNEEKLNIAKKIGYNVFNLDMHNLSIFPNNEFDIIYSSHTLEHAFNPSEVLKEFYRIL
ncbi:MAG: class I SAM-dependent methyltransferase, partial [Candidatus Odinarchaeota archaeon]